MDMFPQSAQDPALVTKVARTIANCDFRVTISQYVTHSPGPWTITVGESHWSRQLVVREISDDGEDALLEIVQAGERDHAARGPDEYRSDRMITLKRLVADSYTGVKNTLQSVASAA